MAVDEVNAILASPGNLTQAIRDILTDPSRALHLSACVKTISGQYTWEKPNLVSSRYVPNLQIEQGDRCGSKRLPIVGLITDGDNNFYGRAAKLKGKNVLLIRLL